MKELTCFKCYHKGIPKSYWKGGNYMIWYKGCEKCSKGAKGLHARNTFQILGSGLNNPSSFLICWAQVDKYGKIKGGTATAWNLAKKHNVPCFNLYNEEDRQRLIKFVEGE